MNFVISGLTRNPALANNDPLQMPLDTGFR